MDTDTLKYTANTNSLSARSNSTGDKFNTISGQKGECINLPQETAKVPLKNIFSTYEKPSGAILHEVGSNIIVEDQQSINTLIENGKTFDLITSMNNTKSDEKTFDLANHLNSCVIPISNLNPTL